MKFDELFKGKPRKMLKNTKLTILKILKIQILDLQIEHSFLLYSEYNLYNLVILFLGV